MKKWLDEFKTFAVKGNVTDMAVGIIIGGAFGKIVTSLVNDVMMPPIGHLMGGADFSSLFLSLNGQDYPTLQAAQAAGAPTLNYGVFINAIVNFLIVAFCVFLLIKGINTLKAREVSKPVPPAAPTKQEILLGEIRDILKNK